MTIYKYNVPGIYNIPLKQVLDVQMQQDQIVVWCIIDEELLEDRICLRHGAEYGQRPRHIYRYGARQLFLRLARIL